MDSKLPVEAYSIPIYVTPLESGWRMSECINAEGTTSYWLLSPEPQGTPGNASKTAAPHEQAGKLPRDWKQRLGLECGAVTRVGTPCRTIVKTFGEHCTWHTEEPSEGRLF